MKRNLLIGVAVLLIVPYLGTTAAFACSITDPSCAINDTSGPSLDPDPLPSTAPVSDTVNQTVQQAGDAVKNATDQATKDLGGPGKTVDQVVHDTVDTTTQTVTGTVDQVDQVGPSGQGGTDPSGPPGGGNTGTSTTPGGDGKTHHGDTSGKNRDAAGRDRGQGSRTPGPARGGTLGLLRLRVAVASVSSAAAAEGPSGETAAGATLTRPLMERLGEAAGDTLRRFAFPLALTALLIAYLILQTRIDKREPKLAAAPVDDDDRYLSFT